MGTIRDDNTDQDTANSSTRPESEKPGGAADIQDILSDFELFDDDGEAASDESTADPDTLAANGADAPTKEVARDDTSEGPATGQRRGTLSEETANKLIKLIEEALAKRESLPAEESAEELQGIVLKAVPAAESASRDPADAADATDADHEHVPGAARGDVAVREVGGFAGGAPRRGEPTGDAAEDSHPAGTLPRLIVMVELADARAILHADRRETSQEMSAMLEKIAESKVDLAFWRYENQRRAADYRLR